MEGSQIAPNMEAVAERPRVLERKERLATRTAYEPGNPHLDCG